MRLVIGLIALLTSAVPGWSQTSLDAIFKAGKGVEAALADTSSEDPVPASVNAFATEILAARGIESAHDRIAMWSYQGSLAAFRDVVRMRKATTAYLKASPEDPIVVPFGKKPEVKFSQRVMPFDLDGDGVTELINWPIDGGWLVRDRNGDGQITSGKELYGDATFPGVLNKRGAPIRQGFAALAHEANAAVIDEEVPLYEQLKVWNDANQNGFTEEGELEPFKKYVKRLFLFYERSGKRSPDGNVLYSHKGEALYADGEQRPIYSVVLRAEEGVEEELEQLHRRRYPQQ